MVILRETHLSGEHAWHKTTQTSTVWETSSPSLTWMGTATSGQLKDSILSCWLLKIKDQCKKVPFAFSKNVQTRFASVFFYGVLAPSGLSWLTLHCPCFSVVQEATQEVSLGTLKGTVSAQKARKGDEEMLGETEEKSISLTRGHWIALQANQWFFTKKRNRKKINWVIGQT